MDDVLMIWMISARYYTKDKTKCSNNVRFIGKEKYPEKILIWLHTIGGCQSYISLSKSVAVNTDIYIKDCFQLKLLQFIQKNQSNFMNYEWRKMYTSSKKPPQQELISRIQSKLKKIDSDFLQNFMGRVKTKLGVIADSGVLAPL